MLKKMDVLTSKILSDSTSRQFSTLTSSCRVELHRRGLSGKPGAMALLSPELSISHNANSSEYVKFVESADSCCVMLNSKHENYEEGQTVDNTSDEKHSINKDDITETHGAKARDMKACGSVKYAKTWHGAAHHSGVFWSPRVKTEPCVIEIKLMYKGVFVKRGSELPESGMFLRPRRIEG